MNDMSVQIFGALPHAFFSLYLRWKPKSNVALTFLAQNFIILFCSIFLGVFRFGRGVTIPHSQNLITNTLYSDLKNEKKTPVLLPSGSFSSSCVLLYCTFVARCYKRLNTLQLFALTYFTAQRTPSFCCC